MKRLLFVFGTRPEAIKLAPVIDELRREPSLFDVRICTTGQHREMLDQVLQLFDLKPDVDLQLMKANQTLVDIAGNVILETGRVLREMQPDLVVVQGDTTTAVAAGMAAFYANIDTAHVEAGLRSGDDRAPWPEEVNRKMISVLARYHFAPTEDAKAKLTRDDDVEIVYPVHLNPNVQQPVRSILGGSDRIHLIEPVDYVSFIHLMMRSDFIVTDSGGVQEEAPYLGKAVLVTRGTTERPEGVRAGNVKIVGTGREDIVTEARLLLRDPAVRAEMSQQRNPYGDGQASRRIAEILRLSLGN